MTSTQYGTVDVPGGAIAYREAGSGPLVLLIHGFPESSAAWRHQLPALAAAGYRAVAMDVRGYGRSLAPRGVEVYRMLAHVADVVALVHGLGERQAVLVGHDWGSPIASTTALLRPDLVSGVALLGVPYAERAPIRPTEAFAMAGGDEEFYVSYFQEPGRAEAEIEPDLRRWLAGFTASLSGDVAAGTAPPFTVPPGGRMSDRFVDGPPSWMTEADLDDAVAAFGANGVAGALNRYRNVDRDWEDLAALDGRVLSAPALFLAGAQDASLQWLAPAVDAFDRTLPGLRGVHLLEGSGHWVQQERPDEVNRLLVAWLDTLPRWA